jgi:hypothetical protein
MGGRRGLPTVVVGAAACAALAGCASSDPLLRIDGGVFAAAFKGDIGLSNSTVTDVNTVNISSSLGLGDTDYVPYVRAEGDLGPFNLAATGFHTSQSGTGTVTADFGNITAGSTVDSDLDLTLAQGRLVLDFVDTSIVKAGIGLAAEWVDLDMKAREQTFGLSEEVTVNQILPLLAAHAAVGIELPYLMPMRFDVNAAGLTLHIQDIDGTVLDLEALLRGDWDHIGWFAGYRYVLVQTKGDIDNQRVEGDIQLAGWLAGISVRF